MNQVNQHAPSNNLKHDQPFCPHAFLQLKLLMSFQSGKMQIHFAVFVIYPLSFLPYHV